MFIGSKLAVYCARRVFRRPLVIAMAILSLLTMAPACSAEQNKKVGAFLKTAKLLEKTIYCEGGNETGGARYEFRTGKASIARVDYRFPNKTIDFGFSKRQNGELTENWTYETLGKTKSGRMQLFEKLLLTSPIQSKQIFRTYELYKQKNRLYLTLYNGIEGVRGWTMKTTRNCTYSGPGGGALGWLGHRYWSTSFSP